MRRTRLCVATVLASSLVLAGCSGSEQESGSEEPSGSASDARAAQPATWPLTGERVPSGKKANLGHPVMVTKIDNTESSSPQVGLGSADLVVEELVEGGLTRLAAFYYSELPDRVGPIRSMRASDIGIVSPVGGNLIASGAAAPTIGRLNQAGVTFFQEGSSAGFTRDGSRSSLYSVMADVGRIGGQAKDTKLPADYLPWATSSTAEQASASGSARAEPARRVDVTFSPSHTTSWRYSGGSGGHYENVNTHAARGDEFAADNVLVLRVQIGDAGYKDPSGAFVPETKFTGSGEAQLFHGGEVVEGTWRKKGLDGPLRLTGSGKKAGALTVPPGHTWIELVPAAAGKVTFR